MGVRGMRNEQQEEMKMSAAVKKELDVLIGSGEANKILDMGAYLASDELSALFERCGISALGIDARGNRVWSKAQITEQAPSVKAQWAREHLGPQIVKDVSLDEIELAVKIAVEEVMSSRQPQPWEGVEIDSAAKDIKSHIDRSFDSADDVLEKILNCTQTMLRQQGELRQQIAELQRTVNNVVGNVNTSNAAVKKDVAFSVQKEMNALKNSIGEELRAVHSVVREVGKTMR